MKHVKERMIEDMKLRGLAHLLAGCVPSGRPGTLAGTRNIKGIRVHTRQAVNFCQCCFSLRCQP